MSFVESGGGDLGRLGGMVVGHGAGATEAAAPGAADRPGQVSQGVAGGVEAGVAVVGVAGPHALAVAVVVGVRVEGPGRAARHDDGLGLVVVVHLGDVSVGVLLAADEELVEVEVEGIGGPGVRGACVPQAGRLVLEPGRHVGAVVVTKLPPVGGTGVARVVVGVRVQQPDPGEAAGGDPVVEVVAGQVVDVVDCPQSLSAVVGVLVAVQILIPRTRL